MCRRTARHVIAMLFAVALVLGLRIQDIDLQPVVGAFDQRLFETYTPYFPGLDALDTHEIFAPENEHKKKIVFLGASTVDSIGCDYTWHRPGPNQIPNVHYSCSIAGQLNRILKDAHLDDWQAFNLARNGSHLSDELYVYARILSLQPEIVIYGDSFNYYMWQNADADLISPARYAFMDAVFDRDPKTAMLWRAYKDNLQEHGWKPGAPTEPEPAIKLGLKPRTSTSLSDLILRGLVFLHSRIPVNGMPRPIAFEPSYRDWNKAPYVPHPFENPDPNFGYFQGFKLIAEMQRKIDEKFFFFFCPQWTYDTDLDYQNGLTNIFGAYLKESDIPFASYVSMKMRPIYETYDGYHHTVQANYRIATAIFNDFKNDGLLP